MFSAARHGEAIVILLASYSGCAARRLWTRQDPAITTLE